MPLRVVALLASDALLIAACYLLVWFAVMGEEAQLFLIYDYGWLQIGLVVTIVLAASSFVLLDRAVLPRSALLLIQRVCLVLGIAFLFEALVGYLNPDLQLRRSVMFYGSVLVVFTVPFWHRLAASFVLKPAPLRILLIGSSGTARQLATLAADPLSNLEVTGFLGPAPSTPFPAPYLGDFAHADAVFEDHPGHSIVIDFGAPFAGEFPLRRLLNLQNAGAVEIEDAGLLFEKIAGRVPIRDLRPAHLLWDDRLTTAARAYFGQQTTALLTRLTAVAVSLPVLLLAGVLKAVSPQAVFTREKRIGRGGRVFTQFRFHTGSAGGRLLQHLHLDGLPLWFNLARGDMVLVGPRPERPEFAAALNAHFPFYRHRLTVTPGWTGWAQIHTPAENSGDAVTALENDFFYIKNMSPALDAFILLRALRGRNF